MVSSIYLCGIERSGKTALVTELLQDKGLRDLNHVLDVPRKTLKQLGVHSREQLDDKAFLYDVQKRITLEQNQCERNYTDNEKNVISDHCVLDSLVFLSLKVDQDTTQKFISDNPTIQESIRRYRRSLLVLIPPLPQLEDDGMGIQLSERDLDNITDLYIQFFHQFCIPFLHLGCVNIVDRAKLVIEGLQGKLPLGTSNLSYYSGKQKKTMPQQPTTSFLFCIPYPKKSNYIKIPVIKITEHKYEQEWETWTDKNECNRFIARHGSDNMAILAFHITVKSTVVQRVLLGGVTINGDSYSFLGCSSSGLKDRKCYLWKGSQEDVDVIIAENGKFDPKSVSKRMSRIGLLFSTIRLTSVSVEQENVITAEDIFSKDDKCFTDGCGGIGKGLATQLFSEVSNLPGDTAYLPSVYQVRYQGYKGVLALNSKLSSQTIQVRPSMKKFETLKHKRIGVCGFSKPHTFGHLNRQYIMLLSGLGVPDEVFEEKQRHHFERIEKMSSDPEKAITVLQWQNKFEIAERLARQILEDPGSYSKEILKCIHSVQSKLASESERLRILIPESRNIYGVCDQTGTLEYGECFLRITDGNIGHPRTVRGQVVVCKNPCYLLGDVRVLKAIDYADKPETKQLEHLVDCLVFPVRGKRPHPDEIAGSDLDGDMFFVSWDSDLIPPQTKTPYDHPGAEVRPQGKITLEKTISYFARQNEAKKLTGLVDRYFRKWANINGVGSEECRELGMLFSRVIDSAKSGETFNTKDLPIPPEDVCEPKFIWQIMENRAEAFVKKFREDVVTRREGFPNAFDVDEEFVEGIVKQEVSNISEFAKFQFAWNYNERLHKDQVEQLQIFLDKFADHINFALFSIEEKHEALRLGIPISIMTNALIKSKLLSQDDMEVFSMSSPPNAWKFYFREDHENFDWMYLVKALTQHDRSILVIKLPDEITLVLQFLTRCGFGEELSVLSGTISGYFYSAHFGYREKYILGRNYTLDLTEKTLQLYRQRKNLTFVCLKATDCKKDSLCDETLFPISVDLTRFMKVQGARRHPLINKAPFVTIEVFVENDGEVPYFDTVEVNYLETVSETEDFEEEEEGDTERDLSYMLFGEAGNAQDHDTDKDVETALKNAIRAGKPLLFLGTLNNLIKKEKELPLFVTDLFISLLDNIVAMSTPQEIPEPAKEAVRGIALLMRCKNPAQIFSIVGRLSRLHLEDLACELIARDLGSCGQSINSFLDILSNWQFWWFIGNNIAKQSVCNAARTVDNKESRTVKYLLYYGQLHFLDLLQEIETVQKRMTCPKVDLSISNLKVCENTSSDDIEIVSFYRASAVCHRPRITQGQFVSITRQADYRKTPSHCSCCCLAQVQTMRLAPLRVTVKLFGQAPAILTECLQSGMTRLWKMDLIANITTFKRVMNALKMLMKPENTLPFVLNILTNPGGHPKDSPLFGHNELECLEKETGDHDLPDLVIPDILNEKQNVAVRAALERKVTLIQGPPGTGKTTVACEIITQAHKLKKHKKILVVAETNIAVDNIVKKLRKKIPLGIIRLGTEGGVDREVFDLTLEGQLKKIEESEAKSTSYRDEQGIIHKKKQLIKRILGNASVLLTTCAGAGDSLLESYTFEFVIVDEATQTKETTLLCSLVHGAKQLVMIGDPKQLGPVIILNENTIPGLPDTKVLSKTLFHRLYDVMPSNFLDTQHRMHPEIMKFPSEVFYNGKLKSGISRTNCGLPVFPWPDLKRPLCFINVDGREARLGTSFYNSQEVQVVQRVLDRLLDVDESQMKSRLGVTEIGVLTLYQGQVNQLKNTINPKVEVRSIDGFQGRENEVIIVSAVRANPQGSLGFLESANRLNVLLTRAKRGLIVVGNEATLKRSELWNLWLQEAPKLDPKNLEDKDPCGSKTDSKRRETYSSKGRGGNTDNHGRNAKKFPPRGRGRHRK